MLCLSGFELYSRWVPLNLWRYFTFFVQISRSRSPQLSPCHNRTQITVKSKQEITGLVNYTFFSLFPYLKQ